MRLLLLLLLMLVLLLLVLVVVIMVVLGGCDAACDRLIQLFHFRALPPNLNSLSHLHKHKGGGGGLFALRRIPDLFLGVRREDARTGDAADNQIFV